LGKVKEEMLRCCERPVAGSQSMGYGGISNPSIREVGAFARLVFLRIRV